MNIYDTLDKNFIKYGTVKILVLIDDNEELWFNANDTASALGYSDFKDAIRRHVNKKDTKQLQYIKFKNKKGQPQTLY